MKARTAQSSCNEPISVSCGGCCAVMTFHSAMLPELCICAPGGVRMLPPA